MKTFPGKKVIHEGARNDEDYELVVQLKNFRACAKAYKNANIGSSTFVAISEAWGVNFHVPRWYRDTPIHFDTNITTFVEAKKIALAWLRETCERDNQETALTGLNIEYLQYLRTPHTMNDIRAEFSRETSAILQMLRHLRDMGYVLMTYERNFPHRGARGVYRITAKGRMVLGGYLDEGDCPASMEDDAANGDLEND